MGIKVTYTANVVNEGVVLGSVATEQWFWVSPYKAYDIVLHKAREHLEGCGIKDFRKV